MQKSISMQTIIKDQSGAGKVKIGEILSKECQITSIQLDEAVGIQKKTNERLSSILLNLGFIDPDTIVNILGRSYNYKVIKFSDIKPKPELFRILPYELAKSYFVFPLELKGGVLFITMAEPTNTTAVEELQKKTSKVISSCVSTENDIIQAYRDFYKIDDEEYKSFIHFEDDSGEEGSITSVDDFGALVSEAADEVDTYANDMYSDKKVLDAPIIKLVNGVFAKAVSDGVSDIHVEPFEKTFQVRYRLDGSMYKVMNLPLSIKNAFTSRIKIMAELDIAERRIPQDGRIHLKFGGKKAVDFRVSTLPTLFGESIVIRVLDQGALNIDLTKLGFDSKTFDILKRSIAQPYGLILVTGPTGSGKTTTLYSILNRLNKDDIKILTAEDPVEFNFKGINQVPVKEEVGMTYENALKAFLRQDPDIIMVGEIRDINTAEIALKAAMTGHLVFATLHTNDCPSTIARLIDIGIPSYMLSAATTLVLSQRLVRRLCPECKQIITNYNKNELKVHGFLENEIRDKELIIYGHKGCDNCNGTGYKGRVGLYELMEVTDDVAKAISANVPEDQLRKVAIQEGMVTLRDAGLGKVRTGEISFVEVLKNTNITKESLPAYLINPDVERYEKLDVIISEGNTDIDFFRLVQGGLYVVKGGKKIAEITQPGVYFGEMAVVTGEPRSASIISKGRSVVKRFPGDKLTEVIRKYPDVSKILFGILASRLYETDKRLVNMIKQSIKS